MKYKKGYWVSHITGDETKIEDMSTAYLVNCIEYLNSHPDFYTEVMNTDDSVDIDKNTKLLESKKRELESELLLKLVENIDNLYECIRNTVDI